MLYLYSNINHPHLILSPKKLFNLNYDFLKIIQCNLVDYSLSLPKFNTHPINTNLVPTKYGYIIILDRNHNVKLVESFDVLKDYPISETDYVFEIYSINKTIKVFPYPFSFDNFYIVCNSCNDITTEAILSCKNCHISMCNNCDVFKDNICDNCTSSDITFSFFE